MSGWIVETLIAATVLMMIVLLVRTRVAAAFGPRIAYLLWVLPALRMVLPPLPATLVASPLEQIPVLIHIVSLDAPVLGSTIAPGAAQVPAAFDALAALPWTMLLLGLWLGGALLHFSWHLLAYRRFVCRTLAQSVPLPRLDRNGIEVCASRAIDGPFAAGVFVKTIVLPHDWRWRYSEEELRLALRHEFVHHLRWDMSANFAALAILSLHWFNPVAHRAWRAFRADQELACDALVLADATPSERHSYGMAVVKSACARTPVAACTLGNHDELKRRLRMMQTGRVSLRRTASGVVLATALVGGGLALTASGGAAAEAASEAVAPIRAVWSAPPEPPEAPEPPAPPVARAAPAAPHAPAAPEAPKRWTDPVAPEAPDPADAATDAADAAEAAAEAASDAAADAAEAASDAEERARMRRERVVGIDGGVGEDHRIARAGKNCNGHGKVIRTAIVARVDGKDERSTMIVCGGVPDDKAIRRITIRALEAARAGLARSQDLQRAHLAKALAGLDAELARLRAGGDD